MRSVALSLLAGGALALSPKRGYVADGCTGSSCPDPQLLSGAAWYYDYDLSDPYGPSAYKEGRFVPMSWCFASNYTTPSYVNRTYFLGFNECNNVHNCNKAASDAAKAWGAVMEAFPDSQLVTPATAGDGTAWFDEFFATCKQLYGASGCRISYVSCMGVEHEQPAA